MNKQFDTTYSILFNAFVFYTSDAVLMHRALLGLRVFTQLKIIAWFQLSNKFLRKKETKQNKQKNTP